MSLLGSAIAGGGASLVGGATKIASVSSDAASSASILSEAKVNAYSLAATAAEEKRKAEMQVATLKRDTNIGFRNEMVQGVKKISF